MHNKKYAIWPIFMAESPKFLHYIGNWGRRPRWWRQIFDRKYNARRYDSPACKVEKYFMRTRMHGTPTGRPDYDDCSHYWGIVLYTARVSTAHSPFFSALNIASKTPLLAHTLNVLFGQCWRKGVPFGTLVQNYKPPASKLWKISIIKCWIL